MMECKKCGAQELSTRYVRYGELITSSGSEWVNNEFVNSSEYDFFFKLTSAKDHLLVSCKKCGYAERARTSDDRQRTGGGDDA